jgi:hypothetical protein
MNNSLEGLINNQVKSDWDDRFKRQDEEDLKACLAILDEEIPTGKTKKYNDPFLAGWHYDD